MSEVVWKVDRSWCEELSFIRTMLESHDFSQLKAVTERLQQHGNAMEAAIWRHNSVKHHLKDALQEYEEGTLSSVGFVETMKKKSEVYKKD